jgi:hypothetical protein
VRGLSGTYVDTPACTSKLCPWPLKTVNLIHSLDLRKGLSVVWPAARTKIHDRKLLIVLELCLKPMVGESTWKYVGWVRSLGPTQQPEQAAQDSQHRSFLLRAEGRHWWQKLERKWQAQWSTRRHILQEILLFITGIPHCYETKIYPRGEFFSKRRKL